MTTERGQWICGSYIRFQKLSPWEVLSHILRIQLFVKVGQLYESNNKELNHENAALPFFQKKKKIQFDFLFSVHSWQCKKIKVTLFVSKSITAWCRHSSRVVFQENVQALLRSIRSAQFKVLKSNVTSELLIPMIPPSHHDRSWISFVAAPSSVHSWQLAWPSRSWRPRWELNTGWPPALSGPITRQSRMDGSTLVSSRGRSHSMLATGGDTTNLVVSGLIFISETPLEPGR